MTCGSRCLGCGCSLPAHPGVLPCDPLERCRRLPGRAVGSFFAKPEGDRMGIRSAPGTSHPAHLIPNAFARRRSPTLPALLKNKIVFCSACPGRVASLPGLTANHARFISNEGTMTKDLGDHSVRRLSFRTRVACGTDVLNSCDFHGPAIRSVFRTDQIADIKTLECPAVRWRLSGA